MVSPSVVCGVASTVFVFPNVDRWRTVARGNGGCTRSVSAGLRLLCWVRTLPPFETASPTLTPVIVALLGLGTGVKPLFAQRLAETRVFF